MGVDVLLGRTILCVGVCAAALLGVPAQASAATQAEQQALLEQTLAHPADYEAVFAYVRVSQELGDHEAAIGALERLLFYNPNLTRVKYELGALYYRVGSYPTAVQYFRDALASPDLDPQTRARIEAYLPDAEKQMQPSRSWGFAQAGIRYQSNASSTPTSGTYISGGSSYPIEYATPKGADWNAFIVGQFANDLDFGNQRGDKLESRVNGYLSQQFHLTDLNVGLISGSVGPRLALAPDGWPGLTIKPYLTGSAAWVGGSLFSTNGGAGVSLSAPFGGNVVLSPSVEWQRASYDASADPDGTLGTADWITPAVTASIRFNDAFSMNARFGYRRADAENPWQSYNSFSEELSFAFRFDPPSEQMTQKWTLAPFIRLTQTSFDAPNAMVDPLTARSDRKWQVGAVLDAPVNAHFGLSAAVTYERADSNIVNYSYDNWSILFGPTGRF